MPFLPSRTRLLIALGVFGVLMLATGLAWDLVAHARDSGLAAEEGVLSLDNPSHVLVGVGILAATIGLLGTAWDVLKAAATDGPPFTRSPTPAPGSTLAHLING